MFSWFSGQSAAAPQTPPIQEDWPKVRILVVGDSGVGKTSLIERLVTGKIPSTPRWTLGCNISVMTHTLVEQTERKVLIEFWDVGGHRNYADSRAVFYHQINGVMLVHDSTNMKSFQHLKAWLDELEREDGRRKSNRLTGIEEPRYGTMGKRELPQEGTFRKANPPVQHQRRSSGINLGPLDGLPILVVGNKCDSGKHQVAPPTLWSFDSVFTSALAPTRDGKPFEHERFVKFYQKVFERRYGY